MLLVQDQELEAVVLSRPAAGGLGFSVAALRSDGAPRGLFIKHIQPGGHAHRYWDYWDYWNWEYWNWD